MLLKTIRYLYYSLFIITPLLMSSKTLEMFEFNKMLFIYLITAAIFSLWCIHYIVRRPQLYLPKMVLIPFIIFVISMIASTFQSIDVHTSLFGYYGRWNGGLISIISFIVLFFVFIQVFTKDHVHTLLKISLITSTIVMLWGFLAKFGVDLSCYIFIGNFSNTCWTTQFQPAIRMFSTLGQPNWLGSYLAVHFFIACYYFIYSYSFSKDHKTVLDKLKYIFSKFHFVQKSYLLGLYWFYGVYLVLNFTAIYFTKSRSSLLAVGVFLIICLILLITSYISKKYRLWMCVFVSIAILILIGYFAYTRSFLLNKYSSDNLEITDSFEIRKIVWKGAIELGKKYTWFGTGPETFAYSYYFTRPPEHSRTSEWDFIYNKAHNEYLNYYATTGYLGITSYLLIIGSTISIFYFYLKRYHSQANFILVIALGYGTILITNFFGFSTSTIQLFFFLIPGMILVIDQKEQPDVAFKDLTKKSFKTKIIMLSFVIFFIYTVTQIYSYHSSDRLYKQAKDQIYQDNYKDAVLLLTGALKFKYEHLYEDQLSSVLAHLAFISSFDEDQNLPSNFIMLSKDANVRTLQKSPYNIQYWKTRAKNHYLYYQTTHDGENIKESIDSMEHVVKLAPTDPQSFYMLGLFYSLKAQETGQDMDKEKARSAITHALNLRPNYIEARELMDKVQIP